MNRTTFWMIKYMNGSVFSKARYMNGVGFEILARTPVPKLPLLPTPPPPSPSRDMFTLLLSGKESESCLERGRGPGLLAAHSTLFDSKCPHPAKPRGFSFASVQQRTVLCPLFFSLYINISTDTDSVVSKTFRC